MKRQGKKTFLLWESLFLSYGWRPGSSGYSRAMTQYSAVSNTMQWGFEFTPMGRSFFGPIVTVSGTGGSVTNTDLGYFRTLFGSSVYIISYNFYNVEQGRETKQLKT